MRRQRRDWELSGRCPKSVRGVSGRRPRRVREASEARPGGVRGAPKRRPRSARELPERRPNCVPKAFVAKPGPHSKTSGDSVRRCPTLSAKTVKLPSVVDNVLDGASPTASAVDVHEFANTTAPVQEVENHRACAQELHRPLRTCAQHLSFEFESCVPAVPAQWNCVFVLRTEAEKE